MNLIKEKSFGGERPLFGLEHCRMENIKITDGESGIKFCKDVEVVGSRFLGKYPLWHVDGSLIDDCYFAPESRSAIWYSDHMTMKNCVIDAPKFFREMKDLKISDTVLNDADETFWKVDGLEVRNLKIKDGTYPFMFSKNIYVDGLEADSKYVFQYVRDAEIHNARITTKDAFWETENVTIYDSVLDGEYLGWHSKNLKLVRCHISGEQPLCYVKGLILEDCSFDPACDRCFEDSELQADIKGDITEIKNPRTGKIVVHGSIGRVTIDSFVRKPANCIIKEESR